MMFFWCNTTIWTFPYSITIYNISEYTAYVCMCIIIITTVIRLFRFLLTPVSGFASFLILTLRKSFIIKPTLCDGQIRSHFAS